MIQWIQRATRRSGRSERPAPARKHFARPELESLEDRITPSKVPVITGLLDPVAPVRVDQAVYLISGMVQKARGTEATVYAFRDSIGDGIYFPGLDPLAGEAVVGMKSSSFAVPVPLTPNAANQFFLVVQSGVPRAHTPVTGAAVLLADQVLQGGTKARNVTPVTVPLITEDSTPPRVLTINPVGAAQTTGGSLQFQVTFSEPVAGVAPSDFHVTTSGSVSVTGAVSVSGSGASYTVTVDGVSGAGTLGLNLIDNDTIHDLLTNPAQDHPLGGPGAGNGNFTGQTFQVSPGQSSLATVILPALNLNLLGLQVQTNTISISLSADAGDGQLLGNLLTTASNLINLQKASDALNQVLSTTVGLLNSSALGINLGSGSFDTAPQATTNVLQLHVAPVHLDLLGALVDTSPIDVNISAQSGPGQILGNIVTDLANLFNNLPGQTFNIDTLNQDLNNLLGEVNNALGNIPAANVPTVQPSPGQVLSLTVPALDLNLLGLEVQTTPITVNADAQTGSGNLLGNVLTALLNTLNATPDQVAQLNNNLNAILAKVVGVLNASSLTVPTSLVSALPTALQTLLGPTLVAPAGSSAPILDLVIASQNGSTPPVDVNLLGLVVTTSNIDAQLSAVTGDGQILGNLLYNVANLANPDGTASLLALLNALGAGDLNSTAGSQGGSLSGSTPAPQQLLQIQLQPLDLNLLGLQVQADSAQPGQSQGNTPQPITITVSAQGGDGKLLGNLLAATASLVNYPGVGAALNNALATAVNLVNSVSLALPPGAVGSGSFDSASSSSTPVLDAYVAPAHVDLLGLEIDTSPIHLSITANAGNGLVLGNVVSDLAHLFDNTTSLTVDQVNADLAQLLTELNQQIPGIAPAPTPPVNLAPGQFLQLTVSPINLNLLGLVLQTSSITVNGFAQTGNGNLLGNFLSSLLNTIQATPGNLTVLNTNLNALLAKVIGILNAASLTLSSSAISALPTVVQTLLSPVLLAPAPGATTQVLNLVVASPDGTTPPVQANLLGLVVTTSDIHAQLLAQTGDGEVLGNLLYNVANLLNPGNTTSLLFLLSELATVVV